MKVTFPFKYITTNSFGKVFRPHAEIDVYKKDIEIYIKRTLVVYSGADFTLFPRKDALSFGINLQKETIFLYRNLPIKIGDMSFTIPAGFLNRNDVPALLGRQACLELFKLSFENPETIIQKD